MARRIKIIGAKHETERPDYENTAKWIRKHVRPGMKIGLELTPADSLKQDEFFTRAYKEIEKAGGTPVILDSGYATRRQIKAHFLRLKSLEIYHDMLQKLSDALDREIDELKKRGASESGLKAALARAEEEREKLAPLLQLARDKWTETDVLSIVRSKFMLQQMLKRGVDAAVIGAGHARDIKEFAPHVATRVFFASKQTRSELLPRLMPLSSEILEDLKRRFRKIKKPR